MAPTNDPAQEAWGLLWRIMQANKPRFMALAQELGLAPMQLHALRLIEPGAELPMSSLAGKLFCDASNVTGIVDRLEARGLIERRPAAHDRRVKLLALTDEQQDLHAPLVQRAEHLSQPPGPALAEPFQGLGLALAVELFQAGVRSGKHLFRRCG